MGFFDKSILGKLKDVVTGGATGIFNEEARAQMPLATNMNNPDGTMNTEAMAQMQQQSRDALAKAGNMSFLGKKFIAPDVLQGFQKISEDAFARQNVMSEMMTDYQHKKAAEAAAAGVPPPLPEPEKPV